jgi:hypothetical protein
MFISIRSFIPRAVHAIGPSPSVLRPRFFAQKSTLAVTSSMFGCYKVGNYKIHDQQEDRVVQCCSQTILLLKEVRCL